MNAEKSIEMPKHHGAIILQGYFRFFQFRVPELLPFDTVSTEQLPYKKLSTWYNHPVGSHLKESNLWT
jgi:hypothetical protein